MAGRRFSDSSIEISSSSRLYDETLTSSAEICQWDHPALEEVRRHQTPRVRVYLTRLEPKFKLYADSRMTHTIAVSREVDEHQIASGEARPVAEGLLFDATTVGRLMCVGVGRFPHNLLRPFVGDDPDLYYERPEALDPACVCGQISRDHGLVFLDPDGQVRYRDFGTKKDGRRRGSKNGTWIDGERPLKATVHTWAPDEYLGLGGRVWVRRDGELVREHVFKLRYELLPG